MNDDDDYDDNDDYDNDDDDNNDDYDDDDHINDISLTSSPPPLVLNKEQFSNGYGRPAHIFICYHHWLVRQIV